MTDINAGSSHAVMFCQPDMRTRLDVRILCMNALADDARIVYDYFANVVSDNC